MQSSTSLPLACPWPCVTTTFFHMYTLLKYAAKAPRQICWHTTALSKAGVGWKPTRSSDVGRLYKKASFQIGHPVFVKCGHVSCAITKQWRGGPNQAKDINSCFRWKALLLLQKILSPARSWLTPIASFDKKKRKEASWSNSQRKRKKTTPQKCPILMV